MFTLKNYLRSVTELLEDESSPELRREIIANWIETLKRHHRELEMPKLLQLLEEEIQKREEKISILVANETDKIQLAKEFDPNETSIDWEINSREIGGAKIVWKNKLYNNTIQSQLNNLSQQLSGKS